MKLEKNSHCSYCGNIFPVNLPFPRTCSNCSNITYINPTPVVVMLLPVDNKLLAIRRNIEPHIGGLALPGGFMDVNESWEEGGAREVWEETGIRIPAEEIKLFDVKSSRKDLVIIFGIYEGLKEDNILFTENTEVSEMVVTDDPKLLVFPLHTEMAERFFKGKF